MQSPEYEAFAKRFNTAINAGLKVAAAQFEPVYIAKLEQGYKTGAFAHRHELHADPSPFPPVSRSVITTHISVRNGVRSIRVACNNPVASWWEFGHHNRFTRKFERVEHGRHALQETYPQIVSAFHVAFNEQLEAA